MCPGPPTFSYNEEFGGSSTRQTELLTCRHCNKTEPVRIGMICANCGGPTCQACQLLPCDPFTEKLRRYEQSTKP